MLKEIEEYKIEHDKVYLVANKVDKILERVVDTQSGYELAKRFNVKYFEVSAMRSEGLEEMFHTIFEDSGQGEQYKANGGDGGSMLIKPSARSSKRKPAAGDLVEELIYAGYLIKRGHRRKNWKKRWFVLTKDAVYYYVTPLDEKPRGSINVSSKTKVKRTDIPGKEHCFLIDDGKSYQIEAKSDDEVEKWLYNISKCSRSRRQTL